jgi:hypothetical protein
MLKFNQVEHIRILRVAFGSVAVMALVSAAPAAPAQAQTGTAPAGLLRLDPPQPTNDAARYSEEQRAKLRNVYARARKARVN